MTMGHVQRAIASAFEADPKRTFTTRELAALAYPGKEIGRIEMQSVCRAIPSIDPPIGFCRVGKFGRKGWWHAWGRT